jgi:hypothetical protein
MELATQEPETRGIGILYGESDFPDGISVLKYHDNAADRLPLNLADQFSRSDGRVVASHLTGCSFVWPSVFTVPAFRSTKP